MRSGRLWPFMIGGIIALDMAIAAVMVVVASNDPSFAVEPDYYQQAADWDQTARQAAENDRLGWSVTARVTGGEGGVGDQELSILVRDANGALIENAQVRAVVFANARASQRQHIGLVWRGDGEYAGRMDVTRFGIWEVRARVEREGVVFTDRIRVEIRPGSGSSE